ncbi:MAG: UvrD-helicase domain-containing protein [Trueperaceae bacterium]|nr:UvrD-helicase domain-containing protein [Trueperaceae bacterium]
MPNDTVKKHSPLGAFVRRLLGTPTPETARPALPTDTPTTPVDPHDTPLPARWLALDIEHNPATDVLYELAYIDASGEYRLEHPTPAQLSGVVERLADADLVIGHNLRRHDVPVLLRLTGNEDREHSLQKRICDTLELSSVAFPWRDYHSLAKLYRDDNNLKNDPVEDCKESFEVLTEAAAALVELPEFVRYWAGRLLPGGVLRQWVVRGGEGLEPDWRVFEKRFPEVDVARFEVYLEGLEPSPSHLGTVAFLHWLYGKDRPEAGRPWWLEYAYPTFADTERAAISLPIAGDALDAEVQHFFGQNGKPYTFRNGQRDIIEAFLGGEVAPLGALPTGGGKSLTFQLPALILSRYQRALTVVISPLQALMADQVTSLRLRVPDYADRVALLSGTQNYGEQREVIDGVRAGRIDILYVSPERLRSPTFKRVLKYRLPRLWVLDEAHTLSEWGHDFRPDFQRIAGALNALYDDSHRAGERPLIGFVTATVTRKVLADLAAMLGGLSEKFARELKPLPQDAPFRWRDEIRSDIEIIPFDQRFSALVEHIRQHRGAGDSIVYIGSRDKTEEYAANLRTLGIEAAAYHARIGSGSKEETLKAFTEGELDVVVATNAFGMGIDRKGIHSVVHLQPPRSPEAYLQEIGRVARVPGEQGLAKLFYEPSDIEFLFVQENDSRISPKALRECWDVIKATFGRAPDAWVSDHDFAAVLGEDDKDSLTTKVRTALFYLEKAGFLSEQKQAPQTLRLELYARTAHPKHFALLPDNARHLYHLLHKLGARPGDVYELDVLDVATMLGIYPSEVVDAVRTLIRGEMGRWHYQVALKRLASENDQKRRLAAPDALLDLLEEDFPELYDAGTWLHIDTFKGPLQKRAGLKRVTLLDALRGLRIVGMLNYRREQTSYRVTFEEVDERGTKGWVERARARWHTLADHIDRLDNALAQLLAEQDAERYDSIVVDLADLERRAGFGQPSDETPDDSLHADPVLTDPVLTDILTDTERLGLLSSSTTPTGNLYYLNRGQRQRYTRVVYEPLEKHYRHRRICLNITAHILAQPDEAARIDLFKDYFEQTPDAFCKRHLPNRDATASPLQDRLLDDLSDTQKRIVTDDESRATLVLAGPGSGKTRVIVHRVAYLVGVRGVPPKKVLVLAYNRSAVAEVRQRLFTMLGTKSYDIDVLTFHALAREITGLSERDAPMGGEGKYDWLLEQAIEALRDEHPGYQYILVDEYQDVDERQYRLITSLARFDAASDDEEQQSYLVAVGDDDQNLYAFRGADTTFIRRFQQDYRLEADKVVALVDNYRSSPAIVACANRFIETALDLHNRLKGPDQQVRAVKTDSARPVVVASYRHPFDAGCWLTARIAELYGEGVALHDIAVLGPRWDDLRFVQHALRDCGLAYQLLGEDKQGRFRPGNSYLGAALIERLRQTPDLVIEDPQRHLNDLRCELGLSDCDAAWPAMLDAVAGKEGVGGLELSYWLEQSRAVQPDGVVLSSLHGAKGHEFRHVFVLDAGDNGNDEHARKLYVGMTRAEEGLWLLTGVGAHPALGALSSERIEILTQPKPEVICYQWQPDLSDLFVSANDVVSDQGREVVARYAARWGPLALRGAGVYSHDGLVAFFGRQGKGELSKRKHTALAPRAQTVVRIDREDYWYDRAGYRGDATHHYLVVPTFLVTETL